MSLFDKRDDRGAAARKDAAKPRPVTGIFSKLIAFLTSLSPKK